MNTKHSKGQWTLIDMRPESPVIFLEVNDFRIAEIHTLGNVKRQYANAKLIAAAPELLEALQAVWKDSINTDINCQMSPQTAMLILGAIAKATE